MTSNLGTQLLLDLEMQISEHHTGPEVFGLGCQNEEDMVSDLRTTMLR